MIMVCKQHVNQGLKMIFLPHIQPITIEMKQICEFDCQICGNEADFKLYNFDSQRKQNIKQAM